MARVVDATKLETSVQIGELLAVAEVILHWQVWTPTLSVLIVKVLEVVPETTVFVTVVTVWSVYPVYLRLAYPLC